MGQCEDLVATTTTDEASWLHIHAQKTGRLFEASCVLGALSQGLSTKELKPYRSFGYHFGMAFQLRDDIEDKAGLAKILTEKALNQQQNSHIAAMKDALVSFKAPRLLLELLTQSN